MGFFRQVEVEAAAIDDRKQRKATLAVEARRNAELAAQVLRTERARKRDEGRKVLRNTVLIGVACVFVVLWENGRRETAANQAARQLSRPVSQPVRPDATRKNEPADLGHAQPKTPKREATVTTWSKPPQRDSRPQQSIAGNAVAQEAPKRSRFASLMKSASAGTAADTEELIRDGADPNMRSSGSSPLTEAVRASNLPSAKVLLTAGALVNRLDGSGRSALTYARKNNDELMVALLLSFGATDAP
jgi:hypothetical protein